MLRVHLTAQDLLRTRFAARPAPLTELVMALATLQRRDVLFDGWRRDLGARLPAPARSLLELVPPTAAGPEFLDPVSDGFDDGLDAVLSASSSLVRSELRRVCAEGRPITPWLRALDRRDRTAWRCLAEALHAGHDAVLPGSWQRVQQSFTADVTWRGLLIAEQGLGGMLAGLHPRSRWDGCTLEIDVRSGFTARPAGRGLTLLPSAFWTGRPLVGTHPDGSTLIVYAALMPLPLVDDGPATQDSLADLLGRTRGALLTLVADGRSTGQLARDLGVGSAAVSKHTGTLRRAGLLISERRGKAVVHTATPLAHRLLAHVALPPRRRPGGVSRRR